MKKFFNKFIYVIAIAFVFLSFSPVYADTSFQEGLEQAGAETGHANDSYFFQSDSLPENIGKFFKLFFVWFVGFIFLIVTIYAGIIWMTARGNEEKIEKAKNILKNAIVGIIVAMMAYGIFVLVFEVFSGTSY